MDRRDASAALLLASVGAMRIVAAGPAAAPVALPPPATSGGLPLRDALARRRSTRDFATRPVPLPVLSNLLWAAAGVNRPDGGRTAPSWHGLQVSEVFVATAEGVWRYAAREHALVPRLAADLRALTGTQDFVATAPLALVHVARGEPLAGLAAPERLLRGSVDAAFIGQNVYLAGAAEGLGVVFRVALDAGALARAMRLPPSWFVTGAQTVGWPRP